MLYEVTGRLLTNDFDFICHQVNTRGIMEAGLAATIKRKYPFVYGEYLELCKTHKDLMGHVLFSHIPGLNAPIIVHMFSQEGLGNTKQTNYEAFQKCLNVIEITMSNYSRDWNVAFPYGIGCAYRSGKWNVIKPMIQEFSKKIKQDVYLVRSD